MKSSFTSIYCIQIVCLLVNYYVYFGFAESQQLTLQIINNDSQTFDELLTSYYKIPPVVSPSWVRDTITKNNLNVIPRYRCYARSEPPIDFSDKATIEDKVLENCIFPNSMIISAGCFMHVEMSVVNIMRHSLIHFQRPNYDPKRFYFSVKFNLQRRYYEEKNEIMVKSQSDYLLKNVDLFIDVTVGSFLKVPISIKSAEFLESVSKPFVVDLVFAWHSSDYIQESILSLREYYFNHYVNMTGDTSANVLVHNNSLLFQLEHNPEDQAEYISIIPRIVERENVLPNLYEQIEDTILFLITNLSVQYLFQPMKQELNDGGRHDRIVTVYRI